MGCQVAGRVCSGHGRATDINLEVIRNMIFKAMAVDGVSSGDGAGKEDNGI